MFEFFIIIVFGRVFSNSETFMTKIKEQSVNIITGFCFQSLVITIITPLRLHIRAFKTCHLLFTYLKIK